LDKLVTALPTTYRSRSTSRRGNDVVVDTPRGRTRPRGFPGADDVLVRCSSERDAPDEGDRPERGAFTYKGAPAAGSAELAAELANSTRLRTVPATVGASPAIRRAIAYFQTIF